MAAERVTSLDSPTHSRRAILAGAVGAVVAGVVAALGRPLPVRADGDGIQTGGTYVVTGTTSLTNHTTNSTILTASSESGNAFAGESNTGSGVVGLSTSSNGVYGYGYNETAVGVYGESNYLATAIRGVAASGMGVYGSSSSNVGVYGDSQAANLPAVAGQSVTGTGTMGVSGGDSLPAATPRTGVYGYAFQNDSSAKGVYGEVPKGRGVVAKGGVAQIRLVPSGSNTHPASGQAGDLFVDKSDRLWFCKGGSTWVKLA
jgi:hypothetical protein